MEDKNKLIHFYKRAGFGGDPAMINQGLSYAEVLERELHPVDYYQLTSTLSYPQGWYALSQSEKRLLLEEARKTSLQLGGKWIQHMSSTSDLLLEKMTLFWHGHFACSTLNRPDFMARLNNTMRANALGNCRELTKLIAREAAMLDYLNNTQNKKSSPNENFARELMELFTIGRDHYTEQDIKESARAFTGWAHTPQGDFILRRAFHDSGKKSFLGKSGYFGGDDIIDILFEQTKTADFLASKLYYFFVSDTPDQAFIDQLASILYNHDYEIEPVLQALFNDEKFFASAGSKIKSPVELLVELNRAYGLQYPDPKTLIFLQRSMGQHLFNPPNVAGWPGGHNWIDSSTLSLRMRLPSILLSSGIIEWNLQEDTAMMSATKSQIRQSAQKKAKKLFNIKVDWQYAETMWAELPPADFVDYMLPANRSLSAQQMIARSQKDLRSLSATVLALPEFQLC